MSAPRRKKTEPAAPVRSDGPAAPPPHPRLSLAIQLGERVAQLPASRSRLRRWATAAIESDARLTLRFVGQAEGRRLNREYRGRDYATNVLTFVYDELPGADAPAAGMAGQVDGQRCGPVEADIVICLPVLAREARSRRVPLEHHLAHLVVHGVLHACGHDHEHDDEAQRMEARESALLARFRVPDPYRA